MLTCLVPGHRLLMAVVLLISMVGAGFSAVAADEGGLNSMIEEGDKASTNAPVQPEGSNAQTKGDTPSTQVDDTGVKRWIKSKFAIDHVQVLVARPLPNETCKNVIFDARPTVKARHALKDGTPLNLKLDKTCLLGFRNDAEKRTLVVRLGEAFSTLAIVLDPKLFTGYPIAPGQQINIPLRRLPVQSMDVSVEVVWDADLEAKAPHVGRTTLLLKQ